MSRAALRISQAEAAKLAGILTRAYCLIEAGASDPHVSTLRGIKTVFEAEGITFYRDGGVGLESRVNRIPWPSGRPTDPMMRAAILGTVKAGQDRNGLPRFEDEDD